MPATNRIEITAGPDRKVGSIRRVATTSTAVEVAALKLAGSERQVMDFIMFNGGEYARSQKALAGTLGISTRTLSRAQRGLAQKGLIALRYDGRCTHYRIRLKGVEMALKTASSKGYAKNGASIESIGKDKTRESRTNDFPSALPTRSPVPPEVPQAEVPAVPPEGGSPRLITRQASDRVWTEDEVLGGRAAPAHPDYACARGPETRETYFSLGDRLAGAWRRATGYRWTRADHKNVRDHIASLDDAEGFLAFVLDRWDDIVVSEFWYRTESPAPPAPRLSFLIKYREDFLVAWNAKDGLDERAEDGRSKRDERLSGDYLDAILFDRTDRKVVKYFIGRQDEYSRAGVDEAVEAADQMAAVYEGSPHAALALQLFFGFFWGWDADDDLATTMENLLLVAHWIADDESKHGAHPCQDEALEIALYGGREIPLATWLARRLGEEYRKTDWHPFWYHDRAALAADGVSTIAEAVELASTKEFRQANSKKINAAQGAGTYDDLYDDQMRTIWDRFEAELREQYDGG